MRSHKARLAWVRKASGSRSSRRMRMRPSWAMAMTCSVDSAHRLASSPPFRLAHRPSTAFELGGVRRQELQLQPLVLGDVGAHGLAAVGAQVVPDQRDRLAAQEALEPVQHPGQPVGVVGSALEGEQQPGPRPVRAVGQQPSHGDLLATPIAVAQDRGLAARCPGAAHRWGQADAGLVGKDQQAALLVGVCLIRGQSSATHWAMRFSSRSSARRVGRCGVQPMPRSSRHTCPGW
jgi:hypothetical protein